MKRHWVISITLLALLISQVLVVQAQEQLPPKELYGSKANTSNDEVSSLVTPTVLVNGDFESGRTGWFEFSSNNWILIGQFMGPYLPAPRSGTWDAWLGADYSETSIISQSVTISADSPRLRLWYFIDSFEACGQDFGYVRINSTTVYTWNLCSATNSPTWQALDLNLSAYNGQTVSLQISTVTTATTVSGLFIDDVMFYRTFADVSAGHWAWPYIESIYNASITGGCGTSPLVYCPENSVKRAEMAVFLERGVHGASFSVPDVVPTFNDTAGHWAEDWIEALRTDGITGGCGGGSYCPESPVTRAQMAVFLLKAKFGTSFSPTPATGMVFSDVPVDYWAAAWIERLASEGITGGCGGGSYCPESPVTRAQMAVFLQKTFNLTIP